MAFLRDLFLILSCAILVFSAVQPDLTNEKRHRRQRRDGAQLQDRDCSGCGGSYTPYFSGQCFMCPVGTPGPRGPSGQQGIPGRDGRDGRDASVGGEEPGSEDETGGSTPGNSSGGAIYVRWGRDVCASHSVLVYNGVAGGAHYSHKGSGANYLCMPHEPIYDNPVAGAVSSRGLVYGAEYQIGSFPQWSDIHDYDVPCAVCLATSRPSLLMIPARNECPGNGWVKEYSGYLMSANYDHPGRTEFVCVDRDPQIIPRTSHNADGVLFYLVEGRCGSNENGLPCGPYVNGYELTCSVCTQ